MSQAMFYLLGPPRLEIDTQPVNLSLRKAIALLAYVAATRQPHSRDALATLFWPESNQRRARSSLRRLLYDIGQRIDLSLLSVTADLVCLDPDNEPWIDLDAYHQRVQQGLAEPAQLDQLTAAAELYTADFMAGFTLDDCPQFDEWQFFQREELRRTQAQVLIRLTDLYAGQQIYTEALSPAQRWLAMDPLHEPAHRRLMELYALTDQRAAAVRQYEECVQVLDAELGVPPEAETTELFEAIRTRRWPPNPSPASPPGESARIPSHDHIEVTESGIGQATVTALPYFPTPFVGREKEIHDILYRLADPDCRLLTLVGPGGIGKTRIAGEIAQRYLDNQSTPDALDLRVVFVSLQPANEASDIISAIAGAANFYFYGEQSPQEELLAFLCQKRMLLILDNFEHLLAHTALVTEILAGAPEVKILVTSREPLKLRQEWFQPMTGMRFTRESNSAAEDLSGYDAVRLFAQNAQRVQHNFSLAEEQTHVLRICQLVDGIPLGIELATAWLSVLPCARIAAEIEHGLDILVARHQDVPQRHRNMRVLLEQSWQLLPDAEQDVLKRLSVFQGGFSLDAAAEIAGATLLTLANLVEKSLLQPAQHDRYLMHELLRQFSQEKLTESAEAASVVQKAHTAFYLNVVHALTDRLQSEEQRAVLDELERELDNIRAAWKQAVAEAATSAIDGAIEGLFQYFIMRSRFAEGTTTFALARSQLAAKTQDVSEALLSRLTSRQAALCFTLGRYAESEALFSAAREGACDPYEQAFVTYWQGAITDVRHKDRARAELLLRRSLQTFQEMGDLSGQIMALECLASICQHHGLPWEAEKLAAEAAALSRQLGQPSLIAGVLTGYGWIKNILGEYQHAQAYWNEVLTIYQELDNKLGIGSGYNWLGWAHWCAGEKELHAAVENYERAIAIYDEIGAQVILGMALGDLTLALVELGAYERAQQAALEGLRLCEQSGDIHQTIYASTTVGVAACAQGDFDNARKYFIQSLALAQQHHVLNNSAPAIFYYAELLIAECEESTEAGVCNQNERQAMQLYRTVIQDRAAWQPLKDRAGQKLSRLAAAMVPAPTDEPDAKTKTVEEWATLILANQLPCH